MTVQKTVYLERAVDDLICAEAARKRLSKAEQFRRYLSAGVRAVKAQRALGRPEPWRREEPPLVLRIVAIDATLEAWLRWQAFDARVEFEDYVRWCVDLGRQRTAN